MFFLDAHCHFYDCYSLENFLHAAFNNTMQASATAPLGGAGIILTERNDCNFYSRLLSDDTLHTDITALGYQQDKNILSHTDYPVPLVFYPGRQVSTIEKIEVLALFYEQTLPENMSLETLVSHIHTSGAVPVVNWAPGKWLGKRGRIVREFVTKHPDKIALGITSLLPEGLPYPALIEDTATLNIPLIAGSDPLPFSGQESLACSYGMLFQSLTDQPSETDISSALLGNNVTIAGKRSSITNTCIRVLRNELTRRGIW
jgi:hypothetical protein